MLTRSLQYLQILLMNVLIFQGITKTIYVNEMLKAGYTVKILIADWFAQTDHNIGTDLNKIRTIGYYNIEVWKAVGMDLDRVEFIWLSDVMNCHAANIWPLVMDIGQKNTLSGIKRYLLMITSNSLCLFTSSFPNVLKHFSSDHFIISKQSVTLFLFTSRCSSRAAQSGLATMYATEVLLPWLQCATILFYKVCIFNSTFIAKYYLKSNYNAIARIVCFL